jgi:plasmid rolling circle replication initiator protein Rep
MDIVANSGESVNTHYLADMGGKKDQLWDKHRGNTQDISRIYAEKPRKFGKLADRMNGCANQLSFAWSQPDAVSGETKLKLRSALFCKARHCPVCGWRRSMRNCAKFFQKMPDLQAAYPKHRWLFLTLTVRNCRLEDLRTTIQHMNKAWQRLIQKKEWPADGWIRTVEVTRSSDGSAHPHFHCMLMVPPSYFTHGYVKQEDWAARWQAAARLDYSPIMDIRVIKPKVEGQTLQAAVVETLKYGTKVEDSLMHADWLYGITEQLHKSRFLATGGALKGILAEDMTDEEMVAGDEPVDEADQESAVLKFGWRKTERKYRRV